MQNLLFEIGTEELPAGYIRPALKQMESALTSKLQEIKLVFNKISTAGTPRRLTIFVDGIAETQENVEEEVLGPSCKIAFDDNNNPSNAGKGFAKSQGVNIEDLKVKETKKGKYCYVIKKQEGEKAKTLLPDILKWLIKSIDFPKRMVWNDRDVSFARPIRSFTALFGSEIINFQLNGVKSGNTIKGNPYISSEETYGTGKTVELKKADFTIYKQALLKENVIVDFSERKASLKEKSLAILNKYNAGFDDEELLDELTNLVEFPTAIECQFEESFLDLPDEVIIAAMKGHQKFCPVIDQNGKLHATFVSVLNKAEKGAENVRDGNERVLRARLADASFFLEEDKKVPLYNRVEDLKGMTFHGKLGNYLERTNRIVDLSAFIAEKIGGTPDLINDAKRAAYLCKADLITSMVGELPELQGIMGREYAINSGEPKNIAHAIEEHYLPRFANDKLPETEIGAVVSLADKFDMVSGCFAIGLIPSGSQDPFALRRSVQGIIRIIEKMQLKISIDDIVRHALTLFPEQGQDDVDSKFPPVNQISGFIKDRLKQTFTDRGFRYDLINAAIATDFSDICTLSDRLQNVSEISEEDFWSDLVTLVERTFNISKNLLNETEINETIMVEPEEKDLWKTLCENEQEINLLIKNKDYQKASITYQKAFSKPVHTFFEKVFVNVDDEDIRNNRLSLLKKINRLYSSNIADLSKVVIE